jgi:hypothetical protein
MGATGPRRRRLISVVNISELGSNHAPYTKGNFQFERVIAGWREQPVLDLRRK